MSWTVHADGPYALRGVEQGSDDVLLRYLQTRGDSVDVTLHRNVSRDKAPERARRWAKTYVADNDTVTYTPSTPDAVLDAIRESADGVSLDEMSVDGSNLFDDVDALSTEEKQFLDDLYRSKMELPELLTSTNRVTSLFASAGFATAVVWFDMWAAVGLGLLSAFLGLSLLVAIPQIRTEITASNNAAVYEVFQRAVDEMPHVSSDEAHLYAVAGVLNSPFTLPYGSPSVYMPVDTFGEFTEAELKAIFQHELGHHKNTVVNLVTIGASTASTLLVAPALVVLTPFQPDQWLFAALVLYAAGVQATVLLLNRRDEETADAAVDNKVALTKALLRLTPSVYHVNTKTQSIIHRVFDVHPPMNERVGSLLNTTITTESDETWSLFAWGGAVAVVAGSALIGYGFLTFTGTAVPESLIFYGTLLTFVGILPQYYVNKGKKFTVLAAVILCISFGVTLGIGFLSGAETVIGAVAQGKIWRQVVGMGVALVGVSLFLLSTAYFDFSPDSYEVEAPAADWYATIDDE